MDIIFPIILLSVVIIGIAYNFRKSYKEWDKPSKSDDPYAYWDDMKSSRGPGRGGGFGGGTP